MLGWAGWRGHDGTTSMAVSEHEHTESWRFNTYECLLCKSKAQFGQIVIVPDDTSLWTMGDCANTRQTSHIGRAGSCVLERRGVWA